MDLQIIEGRLVLVDSQLIFWLAFAVWIAQACKRPTPSLCLPNDLLAAVVAPAE
jgi:hypothetical protein